MLTIFVLDKLPLPMIDLSVFRNVPIDYATLVGLLKNYRSPKDKIAAMEKQQLLIRIKKGLFVVSPKNGTPILSRELIANHLYGPSYVSLESALSYHNLIPERVYRMQSVTMKRAKTYDTPLGIFEYNTVSSEYYSLGIKLQTTSEKTTFLIASPEKALCDMLVLTPRLRLQSVKAVKAYLLENLRVDLSEHTGWNPEIIEACIEAGKKKTDLTNLLKLIKEYE
jgi:predicted transcriptional regulator of viral defense system